MNFDGIIIGVSAFLLIGLFHPIVIYGEYHFGVKVWSIFLCMGIILCIFSIFVNNVIFSSIIGIIGFCCFWSIFELFQQKKRVEKGWFPKK
ncbi:MAG: DUF4491 family protein [Spirochaetaceae bacterium]|jgi:hypothetical protein|nr:DUF4491 family protein [Spirochaetaceae bacterium]